MNSPNEMVRRWSRRDGMMQQLRSGGASYSDRVVGIDLGKISFHLVALDEHGRVVAKSKFSRQQLLAYTANLPSALIGIEACSGAHFIGAALRQQGHDVRLIPAQFVKHL